MWARLLFTAGILPKLPKIFSAGITMNLNYKTKKRQLKKRHTPKKFSGVPGGVMHGYCMTIKDLLKLAVTCFVADFCHVWCG